MESFVQRLPDEKWVDGLKTAISNVKNSRGHCETLRVLEARLSESSLGAAVFEAPAPPGQAHFHFVSIADDQRRKGIATVLFDSLRRAMIVEAKGLGFQHLTITAWPESREGAPFLKKLGFNEADPFWELEVPLE